MQQADVKLATPVNRVLGRVLRQAGLILTQARLTWKGIIRQVPPRSL